MTDLDLFFIPQGTLLWQPIKVEKLVFFTDQSTLLRCHSKMDWILNSDFKRLDRMNFSTLCTILVTFGPETPEFTSLTIEPFAAIQQKSAYHVKYFRMSWTYHHLLYSLVGILVGMIISILVCWSPKGRCCYGNQLNLEDVCRHRQEQSLLSLRHSTIYWSIVNPLSKD